MKLIDFLQGQNLLQDKKPPQMGLFPFYKNGEPFEGAASKASEGQKIARPMWGMTLKAAGSMRFRWNETNSNRDQFLKGLCERFGGEGQGEKRIVPLELIHSKIVFDVKEAGDSFQRQGDGIVTQNKSLIPVVTVADCVPLYFYDSKTGAFGVAHSGWKGTGIAAEVVALMKKNYGSDPRDILAAIGPHIHDCCYLVDKERAKYFSDNFGSDCVQKLSQTQDGGVQETGGQGLFGQEKNSFQVQDSGGLYRLSLLRANLNVLAAAGALEENIVAAKNCTACEDRFGSFRREAAALDVPAQEKSRLFTTQAAFVIMEGAEINR
ncbi:MAG: polyphenol oxidase family protein [Treponema sp.]|nr:polyphenol oxidase family protein [Treponema sp.]MEE3434451.1 polyphenol oxidase family protein [Treponema sp.]